METKEYRTIDKSSWPKGPWNDEPDKRQWQDPETGMACLIVRSPVGALCGYVGVPPGHPLHGKEYKEPEVMVHGGLTFSSGCDPAETEATGICHIAGPGEPDHVWWFGFDCAHHMDMVPSYPGWVRSGIYRDIKYVESEVISLARQLRA